MTAMHVDRPNSIAARDLKHILHPLTDLAQHRADGPLVIARGKGIFAYDESGKDYIEGFGAAACLALGYGDEELIEAATRQMRELSYSPGIAARAIPVVVELAEKIKSLAKLGNSRVFFTASGSEANETHIKLLWSYNNAIGRPRKKKIIARRGAYHGATLGSGSLCGNPIFHAEFDLPLPQILHVDMPDYWRSAEPGEREADYSRRLIARIEELIVREGPETIAAMIIEPVMQAAGCLTPPKGYIQGLETLLSRHDIRLIVDEVICGFGRTGNVFGSHTFDIHPRAITIGKQLSSAYAPIAGLTVAEDIYEAMAERSAQTGLFPHGFTYGGHPVSCAVALKALEIYERRGVYDHVREVGPHLRKGLDKLADRHPRLGRVHGAGLLLGIDLVAEKATGKVFPPAAKVGAYLNERAQHHGLLTRVSNDRVPFVPPMVITTAEIDEMLRRFELAMNDLDHWARRFEAT
jgi:4-aminobutyrate--pyruvate transaminase